MGAMLEMMQNMMGKTPKEGEKPGEKEKESKDSKNAEHNDKDSDTGNDNQKSKSDKSKEARTVPKSSGKAGADLPPEFRKALDAYNK